MNTYVIADIHGSLKGLEQCLERSSFSNDDTLINLGDICDGYPETKQCIDLLMTIPNLINLKGNHDCLDMETELLTKRGWIKYDEILESDLILSYDEGKSKWTNINTVIIKNYTGDMVHINNQHMDLLCTPNHRVLHSPRVNNEFKEPQYKIASEINNRFKIPVSGSNTNEGISLSDNEIQFIAWILTDGNIINTNNNYTNTYVINQSKINNINHIETLLNNLNYKFTHSIRYRNKVEICGKLVKNSLPSHTFRILNVSNKLIQEYFYSKYPFPKYLYNMNTRQFEIFINEIILGDGSEYKHTPNSYILYGTYEFLSNIQILCIINNYRANITKDNRGTYRLNISKYNSTQMDAYNHKTIEKYDGIVWCLNVPYTNFMVRRNGKHFFTGNCWLIEWFKTGSQQPIWTTQGGLATLKSYNYEFNQEHLDFLDKSEYIHIDNNRVFVHGGFKWELPLEEQDPQDLVWDRSLIEYTYNCEHTKSCTIPKQLQKYDEIFVGHTTTEMYNSTFPLNLCNLWMMDTGAGWSGPLTIMNVDTHEYWQSDPSPMLYGSNQGRQ